MNNGLGGCDWRQLSQDSVRVTDFYVIGVQDYSLLPPSYAVILLVDSNKRHGFTKTVFLL
jgi:hypothetical protein